MREEGDSAKQKTDEGKWVALKKTPHYVQKIIIFIMKKYVLAFMMILVLGLTGCGSSNVEESFKEAFKLTFKDPAEELKDAYAIDETLFTHYWKVYKQEDRLAELIQRLITPMGYNPAVNGILRVSEAYYTFYAPDDYDSTQDYLEIEAYCTYNKPEKGQVKRIIKINCGLTYVNETSGGYIYLETGKSWYLALHYQEEAQRIIKNNESDAEPWSGCYYSEKEIKSVIEKKKDMDFHNPKIRYASENYVVFDYNVYLKSIPHK